MDRILRSNRTDRSRIVVKSTISQDLSGKEDHNVAKLRYLQRKNERLNGLHNRHDIVLPLRSRQRKHNLNQNTGHEGLLSTGLMQSQQSSVNRQQPSDRQTLRSQIPHNLDQMTLEYSAYVIARQRRAMASIQAAERNRQSLPVQTSNSWATWEASVNDLSMGTTIGSNKSLYGKTGGSLWNSAFQSFQMLRILLDQKYKRRLMVQRAGNQISDTSSERIKETDRIPLTLLPTITNASSNVNRPLRRPKTWIVQNPSVFCNVGMAKVLDLRRQRLKTCRDIKR
jgi:hypothetical protein